MEAAQNIIFPLDATEQSVAARFEQQVERFPTHMAVVEDNREVTYDALNRLANRVARSLPDAAAAGQQRVAIYLDKGVDYIAAIFGVLKAGHVYVPVDPAFPHTRNAYIIENSATEVVITDGKYADEVAGLGCSAASVVRVDRLFAADPSAVDESNLDFSASPDALAYIIYTSGSTGKPKGVMQNHRNLLHGCMRRTNLQQVTPDDRMTLFYSCSVMGSVYCIFGALLNGAILLPYDIREEGLTELALWLKAREVTIWHSVASVFRSFAAVHSGTVEGNRVRLVIFGGERVLTTDVAGARQLFSAQVTFFTGLGSTETGTIRHLMITPDLVMDSRIVPIGYAVEGVDVVLTDEDGATVAQGEVGEINVHSRYIALGYWNNAEATQQVFSEVEGRPGIRCYRMGDMAQLHPDGMLEHRGRRDFQIKIRGFRVEIGEVESALQSHPRLFAGVVKAVEIGNELELVAYVVVKPDATDTNAPRVTVRLLREHLRKLLPSYMIPTRYVALRALPRTPNNKVDKLSLPAPIAANALPQEACTPPTTDAEKRLVSVCEVLLRREGIGVNDNFFELGGDSLLATQLASAIGTSLGVRISMRSIFDARNLAALALDIEDARNETAPMAAPLTSPLQRTQRPERIAATPAQRRMWLIDRMNGGRAAYNISNAVLLRGTLDVVALERAFDFLLERHEVLRTTFNFDEDGCWQQVQPHEPRALFVVDHSHLSEQDALSRARELALKQLAQRQDLAAGPLWSTLLVKVRGDLHLLSLVFNHIIYDNIWSSRLLFRELSTAYAAYRSGRLESAPLPPLGLQFADYALWEHERVAAGGFDAHLAYWRTALEDPPEPLEIRGDRPRPEAPTFAGGQVAFNIPPHLRLALGDLGHHEGTTTFMMLLATWQLLLARYSGQQDIIVGTPTGRRYRPETDSLIGLFINNLALRARIEDGENFRGLLAKVRRACVDAFSHDELPFEALVAALRPTRIPGVSPLFQHFFIHRNATHSAWAIDGLEVEPQAIHAGASKFDLTLSVLETEHRLSATIEYSADLFERDTIERMADNYMQLLQSALQDPEQCVWTLALPSPQEQQRLQHEWNQPRLDQAPSVLATEQCIHVCIDQVASAQPDALAVLSDQGSLSYRELQQTAHAFACKLQTMGIGRGDLVSVCLQRSPTLVAALLGVMKSGAAYVPLDPDFPPERLAYMIENSQAPVVIVDGWTAEQLPKNQAQQLRAEEVLAVGPGETTKVLDAQQPVELDDLAYVIYTSGSTGKPKGVQIKHRGLLNFLQSMQQEPGMAQADVMQALTTICFDIAALELYLPLLVGAKVVISERTTALSPDKLKASIRKYGVTAMQATPISWRLLLESGWVSELPRKVLCGGEAMGTDLAERLLHTGSEIWNLYGPTETTVWSTVARVQQAQDARFIGKPIANTQLYVTNRHGALQPIGVPGELLIGGDGLARGYLGLDELTRDRFVASPFVEGAFVYRTGDLVVRHSDGTIEFLGRMDNQVKVRGYRIELGEIEAQLATHPSLKQVVVVVREDTPGDKRLVAYCMAADGVTLHPEGLGEHLKATLPSYMWPSAYVQLEHFPQTPNGKVDRKQLPKPAPRRLSKADEGGTGTTSPKREPLMARDTLQQCLVLLWETVLQRDGLTVDDDFFELGGDSMLALQLLTEMRGALGLEVPTATLFESRTIRRLLIALDATKPDAPFGLARLNSAQSGTAIYGIGAVTPYMGLASQLHQTPFFAVFAPEELANIDAQREGVRRAIGFDTLVEWYADTVQRHAERRPVTLLGYGFSGAVVLEVAERLLQRGVSLEWVVIMAVDEYAHSLGTVGRTLQHYLGLAAGRGVVPATRTLARQLAKELADEVYMLGARGSQPRRRRDWIAQRQATRALARSIPLHSNSYNANVLLVRSTPKYRTDAVARLERELRRAVRGRVELATVDVDETAAMRVLGADAVVRLLMRHMETYDTTSA